MNSLAAKLKAVWGHSVRRQLVLGVALVHALLMSVFVADVLLEQRAFLHRESVARTANLARSLASASPSWVLANDVVGLQEVVRSIQDSNLEYACVLSPAGRVLGHTDPAFTGKYVSDPLSLSLLGGTPHARLLLENDEQIDVAAPILSGSRLVGWARVGMDQAVQREALAMVKRNGLFFTFLAVAGGSLMALLVALRLSSGLERLVRAVDAVRGGDRGVRADESGQDEIARLGAGFNAMLRAVAEGEEKFRTVADFAHEWEYWRGPDGRLVWMSPSCLAYTGYTAEEFMADPGLLDVVVHAADLELYGEHMNKVELTGAPAQRLEFRVQRRDGVLLWVDHHCQPIVRPDGTDLGRRVTNRDVTLRRQAEEALRRWANVFENAAWGLVISLGRGGRLDAINPAFAAMHGYTVERLQGRPVSSVYPEDQREQHKREVEASQTKGHHTFEIDHVRRDGSRFPVQLDVTVVKDADGEVLYTVVNVQDITERRRASDELLRAKEAAESAAAAKSDFLAIMSHELRTPLNGIKGMLQVLRQGGLDGEEAESFLDHAIAASDNLTLVLNDVLDVSRMEAGRMTMAKTPFAMEEAVGPVCAGLAEAARHKDLDLSYWLDPALPPLLMGDPGRIRQVLLNLLGNAVKFTERGFVRLDVLALPAGPGTGGGLDVLFVVQDTGMGIPQQSLLRIFEPFTQLENPFTRCHGGAGLGLNIVRRLVSLMGGRIEVYSQPGLGSEFHLRLPLPAAAPDVAEQTPPPGNGEAPAALGGRAGRRVLVVEDDVLNRLSAGKFLERLGYGAATAAGGEEALEMLASPAGRDIDAVLMDIQMPGLDGVEVLRRIRAERGRKPWGDVPVVAVTAHAMSGDRERFLAAGMDAYLAKPFSLEELAAVLRRVLALD